MSIFQRPTGPGMIKRTNPVSLVMIIIVTAVYILQLVTPVFGFDLTAMGVLKAYDHEGFVHTVSLNTEYYRFVTSIFLHGSPTHYLFNTFFGLFIIGGALERLIGPKKYAITLALSGLGGSAVVYGYNVFMWELFQNQDALRPTLGASGAIYGVMGFLLYLTMKRPMWFAPQDISGIRSLIFINVVLTFLAPNISIPGHLGGLTFGLITAFLLTDDTPFSRAKQQGFFDPNDPYAHEDAFNRDDFFNNLEDIDVVDDDDDDDRRVW